MSLARHPDMTWWRGARFGMFVRWGLAFPAVIHADSRQVGLTRIEMLKRVYGPDGDASVSHHSVEEQDEQD